MLVRLNQAVFKTFDVATVVAADIVLSYTDKCGLLRSKLQLSHNATSCSNKTNEGDDNQSQSACSDIEEGHEKCRGSNIPGIS
jgi:hypothetical protein